ncbi:MAG: PmoA family protein [Prolixibacteraceae bacterium]|nr:PmoA family protein [Prolixibacteraceae bacterium]
MKTKIIFLSQIVLMLFVASCTGKKSTKVELDKNSKTKVRVVNNESNKSVEIYFGDELFTSYIYPDNIMKPCLWPIITSEGTEITRKFPLKKAAGERCDHPHHVGMWLNYGDVNGIDYWGHSEATPPDRKIHSGVIRHQKVVATKSAKDEGILKVKTNWNGGGKTQIKEQITFHFIDRGNIRIIDWVSTLTAQEDIVFNDTKEGMFAIRVSRELELPSEGTVILTDAQGNPTEIKTINNDLVSGDYLSSEGKTGKGVWGTRAKWMKLYGNYKDEKVAVIIIDHKKNPGYPAYWHARGYGLFAVNPLGQSVFSKGKEVMNLTLKKGETTRFAYRTVICSGEISEDEINELADEFSKKY